MLAEDRPQNRRRPVGERILIHREGLVQLRCMFFLGVADSLTIIEGSRSMSSTAKNE